jgi:pilus assembly protein CpaF
LVPPHERIVIVEDSRELAPNHPHVVRIEGRPANTELAGAISLTDLVRQSLRMRPDRLVVGEVRGAEICDLLTAMNTGHEGGCGTVMQIPRPMYQHVWKPWPHSAVCRKPRRMHSSPRRWMR